MSPDLQQGGVMNGSGHGTVPQLFHFVMIKPTHYDDDGSMVEWGELSFKIVRLEQAGQEVLARAGNFLVGSHSFKW
jgi:hypothetical protein